MTHNLTATSSNPILPTPLFKTSGKNLRSFAGLSWLSACQYAIFFFGCLRCLLLMMCTHPFAKKALTLHLARSEGHERYFGCNLMHHNVLASFHQHSMAEAPGDDPVLCQNSGFLK